MAKIACLLASGFEDSEFEQPYSAFQDAGDSVTIIGIRANQDLVGERGKVTATTDLALDEANVRDFDALFIPGGHSPDNLRGDERAVRFVAEFDTTGRPVFAICHGPQLLMAAHRVKGRKLTAWKTVQDDLRQIEGVDVRDEPVMQDGNLITSRQPSDLPAFISAALERLHGAERGAVPSPG